MTGGQILIEAQRLVLDELAKFPGGISNSDLARRTGLWVELPKQRGWLSWTILHLLIQKGMVVKQGKLYRRVDSVA
jgi:hypothetical protein